MNRLDEYGYAGLYKALKHKYKYALSTNLPCVSCHSKFLALLCIFPELISLQESCGSRFRLISRLFGCLKCLLLLINITGRLPEARNLKPNITRPPPEKNMRGHLRNVYKSHPITVKNRLKHF